MKRLPIAMAVAAILSPMSVMAELSTTAPSQIPNQNPATLSGDFVDVDSKGKLEQEPASILPTVTEAVDNSLTFSGYARMGAGFTDTDPGSELYEGSIQNGQNIIRTAGSQYQATGRLGNEGHGLEFGLNKRFDHAKGHWDVFIMVDDNYGSGSNWNDGDDKLKIAQAFAGGNGVFAAQPDAYVWAGKRFNGREHVDLNDYFWFMNDGNGGGVDDLDFGFAKFDFSVVAGDNGNNGRYALTTKLHSITITENASVRFLANYGFGSANEVENDDGLLEDVKDSYQLGAIYHQSFANGWSEFGARYNDGARNQLLGGNGKDGDGMALTAQGEFELSSTWELAYALIYEKNGMEDEDQTWSQAVVRPGYRWNDYLSTWLDVAYDQVEFDGKGTNSSWKATVSQNFGLGSFLGSRPQVRVFATYGELDTEYVGDSGAKQGKDSATTIGIMFDAWW